LGDIVDIVQQNFQRNFHHRIHYADDDEEKDPIGYQIRCCCCCGIDETEKVADSDC
jgi:hypothetical protein